RRDRTRSRGRRGALAHGHRAGWEELPIAQGPVGYPGLADNVEPGNQSPDVRIARVVAVVPEDEKLAGTNALDRHLIMRRRHDVRLVQRSIIHEHCAIANLDLVAGYTDHAFDKVAS